MNADLNLVILQGNVTADPYKGIVGKGVSLCTFSVATNDQWTDKRGAMQERATFHKVVTWDRLAESCSQELRRGSPVLVRGRITYRKYQDKNGMPQVSTEIVAQTVNDFAA